MEGSGRRYVSQVLSHKQTLPYTVKFCHNTRNLDENYIFYTVLVRPLVFISTSPLSTERSGLREASVLTSTTSSDPNPNLLSWSRGGTGWTTPGAASRQHRGSPSCPGTAAAVGGSREAKRTPVQRAAAGAEEPGTVRGRTRRAGGAAAAAAVLNI